MGKNAHETALKSSPSCEEMFYYNRIENVSSLEHTTSLSARKVARTVSCSRGTTPYSFVSLGASIFFHF